MIENLMKLLERFVAATERQATASEAMVAHYTGAGRIVHVDPALPKAPAAAGEAKPEKPKAVKKDAAPAPSVVQEATPGVNALTELDVRKLMGQLCEKKGWDIGELVLTRYAKSCKIKDVKKEDYNAVVADATKILALLGVPTAEQVKEALNG
jgi:hypothetical protein